jgi:hypothetical protein
MSKAVVNLVNPKLKNYTNPVMLAIAIGIITLILFLATLSWMIVDCPTFADGPMGIAPQPAIGGMLRANTIECLQMVGTLDISEEITYKRDGTERKKKVTEFHACEAGNEFVDPLTDQRYEITYCKTHTGYEDPTTQLKGPLKDEIASFGGPLQKCEGGDAAGSLLAFYYVQRNCRDMPTALSAALAYTAYIETAVTIVIILVFQACGISVSLDKSKGMMDIADNADNKDFGEELVNANQVKKMINDAMKKGVMPSA